jgi:hypothetical protein
MVVEERTLEYTKIGLKKGKWTFGIHKCEENQGVCRVRKIFSTLSFHFDCDCQLRKPIQECILLLLLIINNNNRMHSDQKDPDLVSNSVAVFTNRSKVITKQLYLGLVITTLPA